MEWFYRFLQEPGRLGKRYLETNLKFIRLCMEEKRVEKRSKRTRYGKN